jgi:crotonobetainyl-CoA:carnitine CoA-transferase CaiB-like acyl-CoA transferase
LNERGFVHRFAEAGDGREFALLGWPAQVSSGKVPITLAPRLGEHTAEVLHAELGLSNNDIESLMADGVLRHAAANNN